MKPEKTLELDLGKGGKEEAGSPLVEVNQVFDGSAPFTDDVERSDTDDDRLLDGDSSVEELLKVGSVTDDRL